MFKVFLLVACLAVFVSANVFSPIKGSVECALCQQSVKSLEDQLESNATIGSIVKAIEAVCIYFPSDLTANCDSLIEQYMPQLINALVQKVTPLEVCTLVQLCGNSTTH